MKSYMDLILIIPTRSSSSLSNRTCPNRSCPGLELRRHPLPLVCAGVAAITALAEAGVKAAPTHLTSPVPPLFSFINPTSSVVKAVAVRTPDPMARRASQFRFVSLGTGHGACR